MAPDPFDTQLAKLLHARGRVPLDALSNHLQSVRAARGQQPGASLAGSLVGGGLLSEAEARAYLGELQAWLGAPSQGAADMAYAQGASPEDALAWSGEGAGWRPGARIGPYLLGQKIGQGGMGVVFKAQRVATGEVCAIKGLSLEADEVLLRRFEREVEAQSKVDMHPNVVRVHSAGESAGYRYLAMDLAAGGDLQQRLKQRQYEPEEAVRLVLDLARGLAHVHACGILHRDLKPANVLFDSEGVPKLVDFGLAGLRSGSSALTRTGEILGTPSYMAPEQALGDFSKVDARADVYGLGAILFECVSGRPPFVGSTVMEVLSLVITAPAPSLREHLPRVDAELDKICRGALAKKPAERTARAGDLANELAAWLTKQGGVPAQARGSSALAWSALGAGLVGALALGGAYLSQGQPTPTPAPLPSLTTPTPAAKQVVRSWAVRPGQRFKAKLYLLSQSSTSLRISGAPLLAGGRGGDGVQEMNARVEGEVEALDGGVARIRCVVQAAKSRVRPMGGGEEIKLNYLEDWKGCELVVEFDAETGAPLRVVENDLPTEPKDLTQRGKLFAEMGKERSLLRLLDACFHFFPRQDVAEGGSWELGPEPMAGLMHILRKQIPAAAERIGDIIVRYDGTERQMRLRPEERTVHLAADGRLRWGWAGDEEIPSPKEQGRRVRGVASLAGGWIKESVAEESYYLEYPEKEGGAPQIMVRMRVRRGASLALVGDAAPQGE